MKNNSAPFLFLYGILVAGLLAGCGSKEKEEEQNELNAKPDNHIETFRLQKDKLTGALQVPGEILAFQQVDIYAKVTSFVKELKADIGSEVKEGQLLITLEAPELNSQVAAAESRLKSQEAIAMASNTSYNRMVETSKVPGTISQNDLDNAMARKNSDAANLEAARATYKEISATRSYLEIHAPFSGVITARNVNPGAYVGPSGKGSEFPLFTLQEQKKLRLAVSVPEAYTSYLHSGDSIRFKVRAYPARQFVATVTRMAGALDLRLRSERVEMDVQNDAKVLLPGMVADVTVPLNGGDSTLVVPKTALVNSAEGLYVIAVVNQQARRVSVKKGREFNDKVEIFGDLKQGDLLVTKGSEEIRDGNPVK